MSDSTYWHRALNPIMHSNCSCEAHCWAKGGRFRPRNVQLDKNGVAWMPKLKAVSLRGKSKIYFICNTCDLAHQSVNPIYISWLVSGLHDINQERKFQFNLPPHAFLFLTKWPQRLFDAFICYPPQEIVNFYIGTTITGHDQKTDVERLDGLMKFAPYYPLWVSAEPLLNYVHYVFRYAPKLKQIIVGGETGAKARRMPSDCLRSIQDICTEFELPLFFKGWGTNVCCTVNQDGVIIGGHTHCSEPGEPANDLAWFSSRNKEAKQYRRTLDGREHNDLIWRT